jgi:hypothetical protein
MEGRHQTHVSTLEVLGVAEAEGDPSFQGVSLTKGRFGLLVGSVSLPRMGVWQTYLSVSNRLTGKDSSGAEADSVTIKMGPSLTRLTTVSTCYNKTNPDTGAVLWDVHFVFKGDELCYRFEFRSTREEQDAHMTVQTGVYQERHLPPLECMDDEGKRFRSSVVAELKMEEAQGKHRLANLIEELQRAEGSNSAVWDSDVINHYRQRYERSVFLKLIRAEVLLERTRVEASRSHASSTDHRPEYAGLSAEKEELLKRSREAYCARKTQSQGRVVSAGMAMVGKRLDVYEPSSNKRNKVAVEGGARADVRHELQEAGVPVGLHGEQARLAKDKDAALQSVLHSASDEGLVLLKRAEVHASVNAHVLEEVNAFRQEQTLEEAKRGQEKDDLAEQAQLKSAVEGAKEALTIARRQQVQLARERTLQQARFSPAKWALVCTPSTACEHLRCKAWGGPHGKGVRCLLCGKELTLLHLEESQKKGYGSGGDAWLDEAAQRHRKDGELGLRQSSDKARVERERLRLEKERREVELQEVYFYDFTYLRVLYDMDMRHKAVLKEAGKVRQGEEELDAVVLQPAQDERARREAEGLLIHEAKLDVDSLEHAQRPTPTFRAQDEARKAAYEEMKFVMNRIAHFQLRIAGTVYRVG